MLGTSEEKVKWVASPYGKKKDSKKLRGSKILKQFVFNHENTVPFQLSILNTKQQQCFL